MKRRSVPLAVVCLSVMLAVLPGLNLAQDSVPQSAIATEPLSHCPGDLFDVHIDTPPIWIGDIAYNLRHDEYMVVWSMLQNAQTFEVWAARVGPEGDVKGKFKVAGEQSKFLADASLAYSPVQDQYLVAYTHRPWNSAADVDIHAKRLSWDGSWTSNQFLIRDEPDGQLGPTVAYNEAHDEYLVVYGNRRAGGHEDIAAQRVRAEDGVLLSWRNIATGANETRRLPDVTYNPARDEYLAVYEYALGTSEEIRGSRFNYHMGTVYPEIAIGKSILPMGFSDPAVATGLDEYLVLFRTMVTPTFTPTVKTDADIHFRQVSGAGQPHGPSSGRHVAGEGTADDYRFPDVAHSEPLGFLAAIEYEPQGAHIDVVAAIVMPGQDLAVEGLIPLFDLPEHQTSPRVACAPHGHCLIVERDGWNPDQQQTWAIRGRLLTGCHPLYLPLITGE